MREWKTRSFSKGCVCSYHVVGSIPRLGIYSKLRNHMTKALDMNVCHICNDPQSGSNTNAPQRAAGQARPQDTLSKGQGRAPGAPRLEGSLSRHAASKGWAEGPSFMISFR